GQSRRAPRAFSGVRSVPPTCRAPRRDGSARRSNARRQRSSAPSPRRDGSALSGSPPSERSPESLPGTVDEALMGTVPRLVEHRVTLGDVEAEVEVLEGPAATQLQLLQYRVGADAQARRRRIVAAVHRRQGPLTPIDDGDPDELTV